MKKNASATAKGGKRARKAAPPVSRAARTDWARVDAITDADIERSVADDPDAAPIFTDEMFARAQWLPPAKAVPISLRVDPEVLAFYKAEGPGYQSRMNAVLRAYMEHAPRTGRSVGSFGSAPLRKKIRR